jgi:Ca-activated chloride channel homolog
METQSKLRHVFATLIILLIALMLVLGACSNSKNEPEQPVLEAPIDIVQDASLLQAQSTSVGAPVMNNVQDGARSAAEVAYSSAAGEEQTEAEFDTDDETGEMFFEDYGVNPSVDASQDNLSTFAMDVDTASYTLARSYLLDYSQIPPVEAIRPEEFINYFPTQYAQPEGDEAFAIHIDATPAPYGDDGQLLLRIGIQGQTMAAEDRDPALLIFVIDISGSMEQSNRLTLAKQALTILVGELREDDRVGIVVYADNTRIVLEPTPASEQNTIIAAINSLQTEGSTYAEAGLRLGYEMALTHKQDGENARVILISDGVANVGETGPDAILNTIRQGVDSNITLSAIGVGMGNFNDVLLEQLANDGNGNYYYVDNIREARRVFVNNLTSTLQVIGYDAKIQVEFNADAVLSYRLIGYENRDIADEDFRDDTVDAGEVGAGHTVTALYEVVVNPQAQPNATLATAYIRYEDAESREVVEVNQPFAIADAYDTFESAPDDFRLLAAIAEFSELLRQSPFAEGGSYDAVVAVLETLVQNNPDVAEVVQMAVAAEQLGQ